MHILVTGANGFLGSHLVAHLLSAGHAVTALIRPTADARWLPTEAPRLRLVRATFEDAEALAQDCARVETVCHVAGTTRARPESAYRTVNVGTTRALLEACRTAATVRRFVFCSSLSAGGPPPPGLPKHEDMPDAPRSAYGKSKREAERLVLAAGAPAEAVALRPGPIYGPRDTYALELFRMARRGLHLRVGPRGACYNFCHVRDVARAFAQACTVPGLAGEVLYLADRVNYPAELFEAALAEAVGVRPRIRLRLPAPLVTAAARAAEALRRPDAPVPALNRDKARDLVAGCWAVDATRARRRLGWRPEIDLPTGLAETAAWYRRAGWL